VFVSLVTCRFDPARGSFDSEALDSFTRDKVVLAVREYFFSQGDTPHLVFVVTYRLIPPSALDGSSGRLDAKGRERARHPTADDLRSGLAPNVRERFDLLRDWRNAASREDGIPAYSVLTNRQLLTLAEEAPRTKAGVLRVRGLGKKKCARYAEAILGILGRGPMSLGSGGERPPSPQDPLDPSALSSQPSLEGAS
jgi:hypothetical protein